MKSNLFIRYFTICAVIVLVSITFLGGMLLILSSQYFEEQQQKLLRENLFQAATITAETYDTELNIYKNPELLVSAYRVFSTSFDGEIYLANAAGDVLYCSEAFPCAHTGYTISGDIIESAVNNSGYSETGKMGGLYMEPHYTVSINLAYEDGEVYGVIFASSSTGSLWEYLKDIIVMFLISAVVVLVFASITVYFYTMTIVKPLRQMSYAAQRFSKGDFSNKIEDFGSDEIGQLGKSLNDMANDLSELEKTRRSFVANVSHELKTPMTIIGGFVDGMLDETIPQDKREHYLNIVSSEVKRLSRMVNSMLTIAKMESGESKVNLQKTEITSLIVNTVFSFEKKIEDKQLSVEGLDMKKAYVKADPDLIHQVIYNLVDNAIKFTDKGGTLSFSVENSGDRTLVGVKNTGEGIEPDVISQIFDRFYKTDRSRSMNKDGVGLGLYIVRSIINLHGGEIIVRSQRSEFSEFVFSLESAKPGRKQIRKS